MNLSPLKSSVVSRRGVAAFSLAEVVVAICISAVAFSGVIKCYTQCARRAQWSGYSLAAQALANKELEQARAAVWDGANTNNESLGFKNELLTLNLTGWTYNAATKVGSGYSVATLDLPISGTNNAIWATNFVTVRMINLNNSVSPPVTVQMVQVDTVWPFSFGGARRYTNSVANYYAPDNREGDEL